jgi:adenylate kinase family enzyme
LKRVAVIGTSGSGKTELSNALGQKTGLPVLYLDPLFWERDWSPAPRERAVRGLREAVEADEWILDGAFLGAVPERFRRADTVVFLDLPRRTCIRRVLWRRIRDRRRSRPDLPEGAREGIDLDLLRWIWNYPKASRPRVLELLAGLDADVVHLQSPAEVRAYLASV